MHAVVVDHPRRFTARGQQIDVQTVEFSRHLGRGRVEAPEQGQIGVAPSLPPNGEVGHEVGAEQQDERIPALAHAPHEQGQVLAKLGQWRTAPGVVEAIGNREQVGIVGEDVFVEALVGRRLSTLLVRRAAPGDEVGTDSRVDNPHRPGLEVVDERAQQRHPAAIRSGAPAASSGALAEGDHAAKFLGAPVLLHRLRQSTASQ